MDLEETQFDTFLERNHICKEDWEKSNISFDDLLKIALDHESKARSLDQAAEFLAKTLQKCPQVHSVRWRVKDPEHLMEKIVRKRAVESDKYLKIDVNNYTEVVTDLVGVRALHLFKYEWINIQSHILENWEPVETPVAYIRSGDEGSIVESYSENNCEVKDHPAGYRSIHYVISTQPTLVKVFSEIQVRTIFEEGWSEIDHKIRYPNFNDNELISYFLTIFNRMAGSADEMGSFVRDLSSEISIQQFKLKQISNEQEDHLSKIEDLAAELSTEKKQNKTKDGKLKKLNEEIQKLRDNSKWMSSKSSVNNNYSHTLDLARELSKNRLPDYLNTTSIAKIYEDSLDITVASKLAGSINVASKLAGSINTDILGITAASKLLSISNRVKSK